MPSGSRAQQNTNLENATLTYRISRSEIENCHTEQIVRDLRISTENPLCRCAMNSIIFSVDGYADDPRELFQIPEFQKFICAVNKHGIPWIHYTILETGWFQVVALCEINRAVAVSRITDRRNYMAFVATALRTFLESQIEVFIALCEIRGVPQEAAEARVMEVCSHFEE